MENRPGAHVSGTAQPPWRRAPLASRPTRRAHFVRRRLKRTVRFLKTVTSTYPHGGDLVGLKLDRQNPIPPAELRRRRSQPQLGVSMKIEMRVLARLHLVPHLLPAHPWLQVLIKSPNLASISLAVEKWIDDRFPQNGRHHPDDEGRDPDLKLSHLLPDTFSWGPSPRREKMMLRLSVRLHHTGSYVPLQSSSLLHRR
jgi:hypothetical protein